MLSANAPIYLPPSELEFPSNAEEAAELEAVEAFVDELASLDMLEEAEERAHGWVLDADATPFQPAFLDAQEAAELEEVDTFVNILVDLALLEEEEEIARNEQQQ